jgi:hypothetical protein
MGMDNERLDEILSLQLVIAWAGEVSTDAPRLGWWRSPMCDEFGGEDLMQRLAPRTWRWAVLEAARAAARRVDDRLRSAAENPDHLQTLFRLGFAVDEALDERLLELKQSEAAPRDVFPDLKPLQEQWSRESLAAWLSERGAAQHTATATGRRLAGATPADPCDAARQLAAALLPARSTTM